MQYDTHHPTKKTILFFVLPAAWANAQIIGTPTFVPAPPFAGEPCQLIIQTATPGQGAKMMRMVTVQQTELQTGSGTSTITVDICNYSGLATQPELYTDTFDITPLVAGPGTLMINYSISTQTDVCTPGSSSMAVHHYTTAVEVGVDEWQDGLQTIFPNPAADEIHFTKPLPAGEIITLFDVTGKKVREVRATPAARRIDVSGLQPGM